MSGKALVRREPDRLVRSYHSAFVHELTLYGLGDDVRFWWPIPARGIVWFAGIAAVFFIVAHQLSLSFSVVMGVFYYLVIPILLAGLLAAAKPEGRRLHVAIGSWVKYVVRGHRLIGGYLALSRTQSGRYGPAKIKVTEEYVRRQFPRKYAYGAGAAVIAVLAILALVHAITATPPPARAAVPSGGIVTSPLVFSVPRLKVSKLRPVTPRRTTVIPRHRTVVHHHHPVARVAAPRTHVVIRRPVARPTPRASTSTSTPPSPVYHTPTPVYHAPPPSGGGAPSPAPAPAPSGGATPRPDPAPTCYPGTLGC